MKTWLTLISILLAALSLQAQYVPIPDANFVGFLATTSVNGCVQTGQLDTTCPALLNDTILICSNQQITNLQGIQYFKNLRYLDCSENSLDSFPVLPQSLRTLICNNDNLQIISGLPDSLVLISCSDNNLITLPALPNGIKFLYCIDNEIEELPPLPSSLVTLNCRSNQLDSLPSLPFWLDTLDCSYNHLSVLPTALHSLQFLNCQQNQLTTLPNSSSLKYIYCDFNLLNMLGIYDSLQYLYCSYNQIERLPVLPNSFIILNCSNNIIDSITNLPNNIIELECGYNHLISLGNKLPDSLLYLGCYNNQLTVLPALPNGLTSLACDYNLLSELPTLPDSMDVLACEDNPYLVCLPKLTRINYLSFDSTAITCLPNYGDVTSSTPPLNSVPLCTPNNPQNCFTSVSIAEIGGLEFSIYPNPASTYATLSFDRNQSQFKVEILDVSGKEVMEIYTNNLNCTLSVNQLSDGLYFARVSNLVGEVGERKLIIIK